MTTASLTCWFIALDNESGLNPLPEDQQLLACLSSKEHQRYLGYSHQGAKHTNLLSRGMLRYVLSRHSSLLPKEWLFAIGQQGKPCLIDSQFNSEKLLFNVSHSGNWLCIAVLSGASANVGLGVDIERARAKVATDKMFKRFFAKAEINQLQAMDKSQRQQRFFDLWALKESYIKATGQGLACSLSSFAFDLDKLPVTEPILPSLFQTGSLVTKLKAFAQVPLSGEQTAGYGSCLFRLTSEYRVAITLPDKYQTIPVTCHLW